MVGETKSEILLGRFEMGKLLGQGSFAKVYVARNLKTCELVAIKVMDKERMVKAGLMPHIKREISILRRVKHPNIVHLIEVMASKSKIYFVMEYVRGGELFAKVAKGRLKENLARRYFHQLISALSFCHARGVFHRDLKPENLLLDDLGNLKVSDFGLSAVSDLSQPHTLFHTFCGTPAYVAPEVLSRKGYDPAKADVWSCGVILFVLMAGYLPFHHPNLMAMYRKIHSGSFRCPRWFSPDLSKLLSRLLRTDPASRLTLPELIETRWFRKGFVPLNLHAQDGNLPDHDLDNENDKDENENENDKDGSECEDVGGSSDSELEARRRRRLTASIPRPTSLNAFDIISFSRGFDLSGLFEEGGEEEARFVSAASVSTIISKLEETAKLKSLSVRKKDCRVSLEGSREGVRGPLAIAAEIFELTPSLVVLEVKKKGGDPDEYRHFCNNELKPAMESLTHHETEMASKAKRTISLDLPSDFDILS